MRTLLVGALVSVTLLLSSGCVIPIYSPDRTRRMNQLLTTSENLRAVSDEWERAWLLDQPMHTTLYRTHGGF